MAMLSDPAYLPDTTSHQHQIDASKNGGRFYVTGIELGDTVFVTAAKDGYGIYRQVSFKCITVR